MDKLKDNKIVFINLSNKTTIHEVISPETRKNFLGGPGINTKILYESEAMHHDALSENNVLVFGVGASVDTGTIASNRCTITARSPITDMYGDSNVGGTFPVRMRAVGIDHLVFTGKAEKPVYIYIKEDGDFEILDAGDLWGLWTEDTTETLLQRHGKKCDVACIGPAGENLVRFASVIMSKCHIAGRTGMGCVMGSKNLKAIVIENSKSKPPVYDKEKIKEIRNRWLKSFQTSVISKAGSIEGSLMLIKRYEKSRCIPIRNFQADNDDDVKNIYPENYLYEYETKRKSCISCPVGCSREFEITHGKYKGEKGDRLDYGAVAGIGTNVGIFDWPSILHLKTLTDQLGMDTIEIGGAMGLIIECQQRGLLSKEATDGREYKFGNEDDVEHLMHLIARRQGIGALMAEGTYRASKKLDAEDYSFCIRKSTAGLHAKSHLAKSLSYITSTRGGDHLKGYVFTSVFGGFFSEVVSKHIFKTKAEKTFAIPEKKGRVVWWHENYKYIVDALGLCIFALQALPSTGNALFQDFADIINALYNIDISDKEVFRVGDRIYQLQNAFNINCGMDMKDYKWPTRKKEEDIEERIVQESTIEVRDHPGMLPEYFIYRGLSEEGKPTAKRFAELGLHGFIQKAEAKDIDGIKSIDELLEGISLNFKLTTSEKIKSSIMSSLLCRMLDIKDKKDRENYLKKKKAMNQN